MIYLDSSVALAELLTEDRSPPPSLWREPVAASRLLEYEVWTRIHALRLTASHGNAAHALLGRIAFIDLARPVLERALEPFPKPVRTLDALHLATIDFLRHQGQSVQVASYDDRLVAAARQMKFGVFAL